MRCKCCDVVLSGNEIGRKRKVTEYGKDYWFEDGMCNRCVESAFRPRDYHEHQLEHLTDQLFSVYGGRFTRYDE
jgi:hypothetical protein